MFRSSLLWVIFQSGLQDPITSTSLQLTTPAFIHCFSFELAQSWHGRRRTEQPPELCVFGISHYITIDKKTLDKDREDEHPSENTSPLRIYKQKPNNGLTNQQWLLFTWSQQERPSLWADESWDDSSSALEVFKDRRFISELVATAAQHAALQASSLWDEPKQKMFAMQQCMTCQDSLIIHVGKSRILFLILTPLYQH